MNSELNSKNESDKRNFCLLNHYKMKDPSRVVGSFLKDSEVTNVIKTSKISQSFFGKLLTDILLTAVVQGDYAKVNAMLSKNPKLLLEKGTVIDYSGRIHKGKTAYQLALGACDFSIENKIEKKVVDGMVEMIEQHFTNIPIPENIVGDKEHYIKSIMDSQYTQCFSNFEDQEIQRKLNDSKILHDVLKVFNYISDQTCKMTSSLEDKIFFTIESGYDDGLLKTSRLVIESNLYEDFTYAFLQFQKYLLDNNYISKDFDFSLLKILYQFRWHLQPKNANEFAQHFNYSLLEEAVKMYKNPEKNFDNNSSSPKNEFYAQKVFGYILRFIPSSDAQCIAQGLWHIFQNGVKSNRSFKFNLANEYSYYPISNICFAQIGYNWIAGGFGFGSLAANVESLQNFKDLCEAKIRAVKHFHNAKKTQFHSTLQLKHP